MWPCYDPNSSLNASTRRSGIDDTPRPNDDALADAVRYRVDNGVAVLTLNRPARLNAFTTRMAPLFIDALRRYQRDDDARVLVLTGAGRAFCSGGDLKGDGQPVEPGRHLRHAVLLRENVHAAYRTLYELDKPTIAMVNGPAVAGGLTLALLCDLRIASDQARLGDTSVKVGMIPDEGGAWLFPRVLGTDRALRMILLSEVYDAHEALRLGLVTELVPHDELEARTTAIASAIAAQAPLAVRLSKHLVRQSDRLDFPASQADASMAAMIVNDSDDAREGVQAFRDKRSPKYLGH